MPYGKSGSPCTTEAGSCKALTHTGSSSTTQDRTHRSLSRPVLVTAANSQSGQCLQGPLSHGTPYLGSYSLGVEPAVNPPGVGIPIPNSGNVNTAPSPGNAWNLNTADMRACGYVIRVVATDRAIIGSQSVGHQSADSAGFCLDQPGVERRLTVTTGRRHDAG
jgi:hypothetical protein